MSIGFKKFFENVFMGGNARIDLALSARGERPRAFYALGERKGRKELPHVAGNSSSHAVAYSNCNPHLPLGYAIDRRTSYRVLIPQSVHLTALIFSLRFMKMSAFRRASPHARAIRKA